LEEPIEAPVAEDSQLSALDDGEVAVDSEIAGSSGR
jgi:urea carboxylase